MIQTTIVAIHHNTSKWCPRCLLAVIMIILTTTATPQPWGLPQLDARQMALISIKISMTLLTWLKFAYQILMNSSVPSIQVVKIPIIIMTTVQQMMLQQRASKLNLNNVDLFSKQLLTQKNTCQHHKMITKTTLTYFIIIYIRLTVKKTKRYDYHFCSQSLQYWLRRCLIFNNSHRRSVLSKFHL